jgi:hypothetical protein
MIAAGRTVLLSRNGMGEHLWMILTDPDALTQKVVMVALVTERDHTDHTVRLDVGHHPFIRHPTNVDYGTATFAPSAALEAGITAGGAEIHADLSNGLLRRVRTGLLVSSRTPNVIKDHCRPSFPS